MAKSPTRNDLQGRLEQLGLWGLLAHWEDLHDRPWLQELVEHEEAERHRRSLERRLRNARLGRFKSMTDFDWTWPKKVDRDQVEELFDLGFIPEAGNVILVGPNGVGKTMFAKNLAHHAVLAGHTARFITASQLLNDLAAQDGGGALERRLGHYARSRLLIIDELGYLAYDNRYADLLFEVVSRRYQEKPIVLTTNKPFAEWNQVFPNAACVVTLVDRLIHCAEIVQIDGESFRLREAKERTAQRARERAARRNSKTASSTPRKTTNGGEHKR